MTYLNLKRGDVLYEQGKSHASSQYWILSGSVTLVRTFIDHELVYKLKKVDRLQKSMAGGDASSSSQDENASDNASDQSLVSDRARGHGRRRNVLSNYSGDRDFEQIASISEHGSDTDENSGSAGGAGEVPFTCSEGIQLR